MLNAILGWVLWYFTFIHPLKLGLPLCRDAQEGRPVSVGRVINLTLATIIMWATEAANGLLFSHIFSVEALCLSLRIAFCVYLTHTKYNGATQIYKRFFIQIFESHSPLVSAFVTSHLDDLSRAGIPHYFARAASGVMTIIYDVFEIAHQLATKYTETTVPPARVHRGLPS